MKQRSTQAVNATILSVFFSFHLQLDCDWQRYSTAWFLSHVLADSTVEQIVGVNSDRGLGRSRLVMLRTSAYFLQKPLVYSFVSCPTTKKAKKNKNGASKA